MTKDEALRLALEALDDLARYADTCELFLKETHPGKAGSLRQRVTKSIKAITAIKAALEAKDEPVALAWAEGYRMGIADERTSESNIGIAGFNAKVEPARENPYINTPPQRKPLTHEEIETIGDQVANGPLVGIVPNFRVRLARAIEAAHGIKGEA